MDTSAKPIIGIDALGNKKEWPSIAACAKELGLPTSTVTSKIGGGGYRFYFQDDVEASPEPPAAAPSGQITVKKIETSGKRYSAWYWISKVMIWIALAGLVVALLAAGSDELESAAIIAGAALVVLLFSPIILLLAKIDYNTRQD